MEFEKLADTLKALSDPTRLRIVALLQHRECCVCELVPIFKISQPAVSKHLNRLKTSGIISEKRRGQWVFYSLNREKINGIGDTLLSLPDLSYEIKKLEEQGLIVNCK
jgi:ArsR family transcriptional regulator